MKFYFATTSENIVLDSAKIDYDFMVKNVIKNRSPIIQETFSVKY